MGAIDRVQRDYLQPREWSERVAPATKRMGLLDEG